MEVQLNVYKVGVTATKKEAKEILAHNSTVARFVFESQNPEFIGFVLSVEVVGVFDDRDEAAGRFSPSDVAMARFYAQNIRSQYMTIKRAEAFEEDQKKGVTMAQARKDLDWLGRVVDVTNFGEYAVAEYESEEKENNIPTGVKVRAFTSYVNGKRTSHSFLTFDAAVAHAIAYRAEGPNGYAAAYFMKMIAKD